MPFHLLILAAGSFGHAVAGRLRRTFDAHVLPVDQGTHPSLWPHADLIVLATDRERARLAEGVDYAAHAWRLPWFPVHLSATEVHCGPVVVPGRTACHACYVKRRAQHGRAPEQGEQAPSGYPEHHVGIAAAFARQAIEEARAEPDPGTLGATVRRFGQVDGITQAGPVVAVDRCPRCRTRGEQELWELFEGVGA
ncbi:TOMM precursor leader peptide-binding protein [Nonomuraea sp. NPDC050536]|uniref:TOMM precursor leader peptide-binding protein n=1 Tax=Nonomuraea sp. NPDC050536 TaxID=3364366 RepID=UPI0037C507E4